MLEELPIITMLQGSSTCRYIDAAILPDHRLFRPVFEFRDTNTIGRFVKAGLGVGLLPRLGAKLLLDQELKIVPLEGAPERSIGVATRVGEPVSPLGQQLIRVLENFSLLPLGDEHGKPARRL